MIKKHGTPARSDEQRWRHRLLLLTATFTWLAGLGLLACGGGTGGTPYEDREPEPAVIPNTKAYPPTTNLSCDAGSALSYTSFGASFLLKYCRSCHSSSVAGADRRGASLTANFDTAAEAQVWRAAILGRLNGGAKKMPPAGEIDATDLKAAKEWLGCGAPSASE